MSFCAESFSTNLARVGVFSGLSRVPGFSMESPACFLTTKGCLIPHLTLETMTSVHRDISNHSILMSPLETTYCFLSSFHGGGIESLPEFSGTAKFPMAVCIADPTRSQISRGTTAKKTTLNNKTGVSIWPRNGKVLISPEKYVSILQMFKPDVIFTLCDADTPKDCSQKRLKKATERSKTMLENLVKLLRADKSLQETPLFVSITGAFDDAYRTSLLRHALSTVGQKNVSGVALEGFHTCASEALSLKWSDLEKSILAIKSELPKETAVYLPGALHPLLILDAIEKGGVDLFDSSLCTVATELGIALLLPLATERSDKAHSDCRTSVSINDTLPVTELLGSPLELSLRDAKYAGDCSVLAATCGCTVCRNGEGFSRAYILHLINTREMLGQVLLMMHNLWQMLEFYRLIRHTLREKKGSLEDLRQRCVRETIEGSKENEALKSVENKLA